MESRFENQDTLTQSADDELVARAQGHDEAAFGELMRRTSPASLRLALSILHDRQEAEDEVQNSYFNAWKNMPQFQRESKFSTWMTRIVVNQCLMRLRRLRAARFEYLDHANTDAGLPARELTDQTSTPEESLGHKELNAVLQREIRRLPPLLRNVLILRDVEELSSAEVAARLNISVSAVKSRLLRARRELREHMEKHAGRAGLATLTA
ncbi:MAG: sigma-70 family RNA polymerase sigma factor [Bryobacteraceae bacterium]